ncbi:MAG: 4Fe-4S binding protein [Chloroflexi bacterium]|nr:4Fe-4S binding protein [Chloroflexota bacterium]MCL5074420.1 4Fe-4S binding protein [Chloroflexota bacterium]
MASLETTLCGITLPNPFILSSGPLSYSGEALARALEAGAGAVVTKTIRREAAINPTPHMVRLTPSGLLNCEKWADLGPREWIEKEIPRAKQSGGIVIASLGHTVREVIELVEAIAGAGSDMIELVSYEEDQLVSMVTQARRRVHIPLLAKLSPNWRNLANVVAGCIAEGANGITAIDSVGPVLRLDIRTRKPILGGSYGLGWLSGPPIKPIALAIVAQTAMANRVDIVGVGGVSTPEDAVEMFLAGAKAIGVCTAPLTRGLSVFQKLTSGLGRLLDELGYASIAEVSGASLPYLIEKESVTRLNFTYDKEKCTDCQLCVTLCPYRSRHLVNYQMSLDENTCRFCGYCVSICAPKALTIVP